MSLAPNTNPQLEREDPRRHAVPLSVSVERAFFLRGDPSYLNPWEAIQTGKSQFALDPTKALEVGVGNERHLVVKNRAT